MAAGPGANIQSRLSLAYASLLLDDRAGARLLVDEAELRVLHLLPTNLSIAEIGQRLYVSRNTAKSHTAALYRKFGVSSRGEAVRMACDVGLLPP